MVNKVPIPQQETGDVTVSVNNALNLTNSHGILVGAIHRMSPLVDPDKKQFGIIHSTILFYKDGWQHTVLGFEIGTMSDATNKFKWILQTIPGVGHHIEGNFLVDLPNGDDIKQAFIDGIAMHFIFRAASIDIKSCDFLNKKNIGLETMAKVIIVLAKDELCELVESW